MRLDVWAAQHFTCDPGPLDANTAVARADLAGVSVPLTFHATRQPSDGRVAFCDRARCGEGGEGSAAFPRAFTCCATLPVVGELSSVAQFAVVRDGADGEEVRGAPDLAGFSWRLDLVTCRLHYGMVAHLRSAAMWWRAHKRV